MPSTAHCANLFLANDCLKIQNGIYRLLPISLEKTQNKQIPINKQQDVNKKHKTSTHFVPSAAYLILFTFIREML
ncbi:hypothetical protein CGT99_03595 [Vibrio metoecus]|nr:hypothetical protein CGT99_03595 [Vibrio metoecus]